jgi:hypothetical protein
MTNKNVSRVHRKTVHAFDNGFFKFLKRKDYEEANFRTWKICVDSKDT